nr:PEPxxWA-CTERM sorting domain-containing protein [Sphingomonas sp. ID1715]
MFLAAASAVALGAQADAAVITQHFAVTATGFEADAPVQNASGVFSFTYDNAAFITPISSVGLKITGFNVPFDREAKFSFNKGNDFLMVSDNITGLTAFTVSPVIPGFGFFLRHPGGTPEIQSFLYSGNGAIWHASQISVQRVAGVPEPASWVLMIGGFGLAGAALRTRRSPLVRFA